MSIAQNFPLVKPSLLLDFSNTEALDPRISFARATTATYYGTRTAVAEQNLLLQSQTFDNGAWLKDALTVTANTTTAPDGTTTADTLIENTATSNHGVRGTVVANVGFDYTISVFAKPNGRDFLHLSYNAAASNFYAQATFNVSTGAVTGSGAVGWTLVSTAISSAPNGFYRCSLTFTVVSQAGASNCLCVSDTGTPSVNTVGRSVYTGDGTSGLFLWGAQLEQRSTVTAYTPTTTQPVTNYIPVLETAASGVARFDHNPVTFESLGLLIEEQRTNLFTYSSQFDNAAWTKTFLTVTANTVVAPDGTLTADKLVESTTNGYMFVNQSISQVSGTQYTMSVYAKAAERSRVMLLAQYAGGGSGYVIFNLSTGVVDSAGNGLTASAGSINNVGNGFYRCTLTYTSTTTGSAPVNIFLRNENNSLVYTGDGYSGIYIWGAQLEAGAFSTSYIPTVASQVTRAVDAASMTGANFSSWFNAAQGTIYSESLYYYTGDAGESESSGFGSPVAFGDGVTNQFEPLAVNNATTRVRRSSSYYRTSAQALQLFESTDNTYLGNTQMKSAVAMAINDYASSVNGATVRTSAVPYGVVGTRLVIGGNYAQTNFSGTIKKIAYYPLRLSNTNLQALTG